MIDTFVTFRVRPGRTEEFEAIHRKLLAHMSGMPGCIDVDVHHSAAEPLEYMVHGRWESKAAWKRAHQTNPEFRSLFAQLPVDLLNIFRFDDHGRLVEEWVRTDYRSFFGNLERRRIVVSTAGIPALLSTDLR
jgi:quinol monooxygenase YgiN